ncbi:MAG: hypothetical protein ABL888_14020 [Pirellulaceae bacterium]
MVIARGRVVSHDQLHGWNVEVIDDENATGGIYVIYVKPDDPSEALDDWFENLGDLQRNLPKMHRIDWHMGGERIILLEP